MGDSKRVSTPRAKFLFASEEAADAAITSLGKINPQLMTSKAPGSDSTYVFVQHDFSLLAPSPAILELMSNCGGSFLKIIR